MHVLIFLSGVVIFKTVWNGISMILSWRFVSLKNVIARNQSFSPKIHIVIPLLCEQDELTNLLGRFVKIISSYSEASLTLLTTERESLYPVTGFSTATFVENALSALPVELRVKVHHAHYPGINKNLAEQLNWYLRQLVVEGDSHDFIAIYNADSDPGEKSIEAFLSQASYGNGRVYQQSSLFLKNETEMQRGWHFFGITNSISQSIWTLTHEIPRLYKNRLFPNGQLAHCVAHGLFVRCDALVEMNFFPEDSPIEDMYLGFIFRAKGEIIHLIPMLESSRSPSTLSAILRQKFVWFWGPFGYFYFWNRFRRQFPEIWKSRKWWILLISVQGALSATNWFVITPLFLALIVGSLLLHSWIGVAVFLFYAWIPFFTFYFLTKRNPARYSLTFLCQPVLLLLHSFPAYFTIIAHVFYSTRGWEGFLRPKTRK